MLRPAVLIAALASTLGAQQSPARRTSATTSAPTTALDSISQTGPLYLRALRWRNVGPHRGGRSAAIAGDPQNHLVNYFGGVNGGVWKTMNGGQSWRNITDGKSNISSVGAIALAPSDPGVIYVGGGEADLREDLTYGDGMWRTTDNGETWTHLGLTDAYHIARIQVDPRNSDVVYVAAMGHAFGPNAERGVFKTTDGGKTWKKMLFLNDSTGAIDLSMDPSNPRVLYAAMWRFQRFPWGMSSGGGRSGLWKSIDAGETWRELTYNEGLPEKLIGRIGVSVSPANPRRVYATVEAADSAGGIFRSDDAGKSWSRMSGDQRFMVRPFYYSVVTADPIDQNTVYVMNLGTWRSIDGGRTYTRIRLPHGDTHQIWIDPRDNSRLLSANDGGATVSLDRGETWSSIYNQPTAQFYHVTTDNQFPYHIYGAQQDNSTVNIPSRNERGGITREDWWPAAGCENAYIAIEKDDPNVSYGGCYMGTISRYDRATRQFLDVSPYQNNWDGFAVKDVPYRFQWTFPLLFSPHDSRLLYATSQYAMRSRDRGMSWEKFSPDLTLHDTNTMQRSGGPVTGDMTGTEWYATIFAFAESPVTKGVLWSGSDDGLIHVSRDDGKSWQNVTPRSLGRFTRVSIIEPSHYDPGTAYVAANRYQQDDFKPYLWKTTDYGATWTQINAGIPTGAYTRAIREDPVRRGLLYAGTETGVYFSFDDGRSWQPLQLNLPRVSVRDLHIHDSDLIAATHGRAFWIIDDISPLRQWSDSVRRQPAHLFKPSRAWRVEGGVSRDPDIGENPPNGVLVDYFLAQKPAATISLEFLDAGGRVIRKFESKDESGKDSTARRTSADSARGTDAKNAGKLDSLKAAEQNPDSLRAKAETDTLVNRRRRRSEATEDSTLAFIPADSIVPARIGINRFVWNMRYEAAKGVKDIVNDEGDNSGPKVAPGDYTVRLTAAGRTITQPVTIVEDPRVKVSRDDLVAQERLALQIRDRLNDIADAHQRIGDIDNQLDARTRETKDQPYADRVKQLAKPMRDTLGAIRGDIVEVHSHADQSTLHFPVKLYNQFMTLNAMIQSADAAPTQGVSVSYRDMSAQLATQLARLKRLEENDLAAFNKVMRDLGAAGVIVKVKTVQ